jgi:hypothetical protein
VPHQQLEDRPGNAALLIGGSKSIPPRAARQGRRSARNGNCKSVAAYNGRAMRHDLHRAGKRAIGAPRSQHAQRRTTMHALIKALAAIATLCAASATPAATFV